MVFHRPVESSRFFSCARTIGFQHRINAGLVALLTPGLKMIEHGFFDPQGHMLGSVRLYQLGVGPEIRIGFSELK